MLLPQYLSVHLLINVGTTINSLHFKTDEQHRIYIRNIVSTLPLESFFIKAARVWWTKFSSLELPCRACSLAGYPINMWVYKRGIGQESCAKAKICESSLGYVLSGFTGEVAPVGHCLLQWIKCLLQQPENCSFWNWNNKLKCMSSYQSNIINWEFLVKCKWMRTFCSNMLHKKVQTARFEHPLHLYRNCGCHEKLSEWRT